MSIKAIALAALLLMTATIVRADDYFLSEEEQEELEKEAPKEDFMKNFACLVATQRFVYDKRSIIEKYASKPNQGFRSKRLNAAVFRTCFETLTEDEKAKVAAAKTRSDFDQITFSGLTKFDVTVPLSNESPELTSDEASFSKMFTDVEKKVREIQKNTMRENPDKEEEEDDDTYEEIKRARGQKPKIGALELDSPMIKYMVFAFIAVLGGLFYLMFQRLNADAQPQVKKDKKKNKKAE